MFNEWGMGYNTNNYSNDNDNVNISPQFDDEDVIVAPQENQENSQNM